MIRVHFIHYLSKSIYLLHLYFICYLFIDEDYQPANTPVLSELLSDELASEKSVNILSEIELMINKIEVEEVKEGSDTSSSRGTRNDDKEILKNLIRYILILNLKEIFNLFA